MALIKVSVKDGDKTPTRSRSSKQEKAVAKAFGGERTKNSGATPFDKGDVLTDKFLLECKTKMRPSDSMTIQKEWFEKNLKETLVTGKEYSAVVFNFGPGEENHYIIDENLFRILLETLESR